MATHKCGKCKHNYEEPTIRKCPHPAVNKKLGTKTDAKSSVHICVFCCKMCEYSKKQDTGLVCNYGK